MYERGIIGVSLVLGKWRDIDDSTGRPPLLKRNKMYFNQFKSGGTITRFTKSIEEGLTRRQSNLKSSFTRQVSEQMLITYRQCTQCL